MIVAFLSLQLIAFLGPSNSTGQPHVTSAGFSTPMHGDIAKRVGRPNVFESALAILKNEKTEEEQGRKTYRDEKQTLKKKHHTLKHERSKEHHLEKVRRKLSKKIRLTGLDGRRKASLEQELKADDRTLKEMGLALKVQGKLQHKEKDRLQGMSSLIEEEEEIRRQQALALGMHNMRHFQALRRQHDHVAQRIHHEEAEIGEEVKKIAKSQETERRVEKNEHNRLAQEVSEVVKVEHSKSELKDERQLLDKAKKLENKERVDLHDAEKLMKNEEATLKKERDALAAHNFVELKKLEKSEQRLADKIRKEEKDATKQLQRWHDTEKHETEVARSVAQLTHSDKTLSKESAQQHKLDQQDAKERGVLQGQDHRKLP